MLRIHFTPSDLVNVRIAVKPDPMWELALSMHALRYRTVPLALSSWRTRVGHALRPGSPARRGVQPLLAVNPALGYFPDLLTPAESADGFEAGVEAVVRTPKSRLFREISQVQAEATADVAASVDDLAHGRLPALKELERGLQAYREAAIDGHWGRIVTAFDADRARRARQLVDGGLAAFLDQLHPSAHFAGTVLSIGAWGVGAHRDLHLGGRGLTVVPCYFKQPRQLLVLADDDLPPVLVYPIAEELGLLAATSHQSLADLLGATRARVLERASELTTSEIAGRLELTAPATSKHLTVLRNAGLIATVRHRHRSIHVWTPLGRALLDQQEPTLP